MNQADLNEAMTFHTNVTTLLRVLLSLRIISDSEYYRGQATIVIRNYRIYAQNA